MTVLFIPLLLSLSPLQEEPEPTPAVEQPSFFSVPGIATRREGNWIGSEHLFNMPSTYLVNVEVVMQDSFESGSLIQASNLQEMIEQTLVQNGLFTRSDSPKDFPLPLLNLRVIVANFADVVSVSISLQLFEPVTLKRVVLDPSITFQAVTWERQILVAGRKPQMKAEVEAIVKELVESYSQVYKTFH